MAIPPIAGMVLFLLLAGASCRPKEPSPIHAKAVNPVNKRLIDSLLPASKALFKAVHKDTSRKDLFRQGLQLLVQAERLAEQEQYALDSLGMVVREGAWAFLLMGDSAAGQERMVYAKQLYRRAGNSKLLGQAHLISSWFYNAGPALASRLAELDTAARLMLDSRDTIQYLKAVHRKAFSYNDAGQKDAYRQTLINLLTFQKRQFPVNISQTAYHLANHYEKEGQSAEAFQYRKEAVDYLRHDTDRAVHPADYYQRLGYCYFDLGKRVEAKQCFENALQAATIAPYNDAGKAGLAISWVAACWMAQRQFKEGLAYVKSAMLQYPPATQAAKILFNQLLLEFSMRNGQYTEANKYAGSLLLYEEQEQVPDDRRQYSFELAGRLYLQQRDLVNARVYLLKALDVARKHQDLSSMIEDCGQLFRVDSLAGRYLDAIRWFQNYKVYLDQKRLRTQNRDIRELDIKYETEKKAAAVKNLTEKNQLQQSLIQQASFVKDLSVATAVLLVLVLLILFGRYRLKQRVNKQLKENQDKINQQNQALEQLIIDERKLLAEKTQLLEEKDWLLKEVHHRVKNNLQIMMCLLESQSMYAQDDALRALEDSQRRIYAMSLIHQKLYQSEDIRTLNMERYMREFVYYLKESLDVSNRVLFRFDVAPVELSVTQAIPLALIVNEAVTNSIKYAFPDNAPGEIGITLVERNEEVELQLADNGIGLPPDVWQGKRNSLGMELIKGLCAEIKGAILFQAQGGTRIIIRFKRVLFKETVYPPVAADEAVALHPDKE